MNPMRYVMPVALLLLSGAATPPPPRPGAVKMFKDWAVGCDNGLSCTMASLVPDDPDGAGPPVTINLTRAPGATSHFSIQVEGVSERSPAIVIDGRAYRGDVDAIAAAMADGRSATVQGTKARVSLAGASAALRYIDAMQGRGGTVTATVARGTAPATAVPPAPALPTLVARALKPTTSPLDARMVATMRKMGGCEEPSDFLSLDPSVADAGKGQRIVLLPCHGAAYNVGIAVFVLDGTQIRPASFDAPVGFEDSGDAAANRVHEIVSGSIDDNELTSFTKGRGLGDCGVQQLFVWDGERMRLARQSEMPDCRGNIDFIDTWRTAVRF